MERQSIDQTKLDATLHRFAEKVKKLNAEKQSKRPRMLDSVTAPKRKKAVHQHVTN